MVTSSQLTPGMTISLDGKFYRVESVVKVTVTKGTPFLKAKLRDITSSQLIERNFKPNQEVDEVTLQDRKLEYLFSEGKGYLFLDIGNLERVFIPSEIVGDKVHFLKEGIELKAQFYGQSIFSIELPQFLELMVVSIEAIEDGKHSPSSSSISSSRTSKLAQLETGAGIEVPPFIEPGDIIKVDTKSKEYIQRV